MAAVLEQAGIVGLMGSIDELLGFVGLSNPFYDLVREADFDPDPSVDLVDVIGPALSGVGSGTETGIETLQWSGDSAAGGVANEECLATLSELLLDLGILLVEVLIEFLDILIELLNLAMSLVIAFIVIVSVIVAVAAATAFFTAGSSIAAAAASIQATLVSFLGTWSIVVTGIVAMGQFATFFIDQFIEDIQADLAAARAAGCIYSGPLNSWDPDFTDIPGVLNW